jgi:hypothetical protein
MNGEGEQRIVDSLGRLHSKVDDLAETQARTREEQAGLASSVRGQERQLERIGDRIEREQEERRKAIGKATERIVRVEQQQKTTQAKVVEVETTQKRPVLPAADAALVLAQGPAKVPSIRAQAHEIVQVERWKALTALGVPIALALAGWIAHLYR